jgi:release factor glutamine methyltransferase
MAETASAPSLWSGLRKRLVRLWLALRYRLFGRRDRRLVIERIADVPLLILPEVFNPVLFRTGEMLARAVQASPLLKSDDGETPLVLDLGCGSGVGAVFAARRGAHVLATDLNPEAVRCARLNALLNHFEDKIEARPGDLFAPVPDERFDLVLFNPPFYRGRPKDKIDMAWRAENIFERFAADLKDHLKPAGQALIVLSTDGEERAALDQLQANGFILTPALRRDFLNEVITVYSVIPHP